MKKITNLTYVLGALLMGSAFTACDKFKEDVPPARMSNLILNDDQFTTTINTGLQVNVLANDTISGTATLQFGQPQHGTIQTNNNGSVFYMPASNYTGPDSFSYEACLGNNNCATAWVSIDVRTGGPNDSTVVCQTMAFDDQLTIQQNSPDTISVMQNDNLCGAAGTAVSISQHPAHGQVTILPNKAILYEPILNFTGSDELTYTISNAKGTASAKLRVNVTPAPVVCNIKANPDSTSFARTLGAIDTVTVAVVANDITCPNDGPVIVQLLSTSTQFASLQVVYNGQKPLILYTTHPNAPKNVFDNFQYRICQGNKCSTSSVGVFIR